MTALLSLNSLYPLLEVRESASGEIPIATAQTKINYKVCVTIVFLQLKL